MATSLFVWDKSATTPFLELFVQRSLLSEDGSCCSIAIVVGCSCLPSSTKRNSLRSRFSFCLSWSICSYAYPPCGKEYCLLVYHCLWRHTPWKRALHWWWLLQMIEPYDAVTVFLRPFLNYRFFWSHYFSYAKVAWCFDRWNPSCAVASLWPIK